MANNTGLKCERSDGNFFKCRAEWTTEFSVWCAQPASLSVTHREWEGVHMSCARGIRGDIQNFSDLGGFLDDHPHVVTGAATLLIGIGLGLWIRRRRAAPQSPRP